MYKIKQFSKIKTEINLPSDKSISHRAAIVSSLATKATTIYPFTISKDTQVTLNCLKKCGIKFNLSKKNALTIQGEGFYFSKERKIELFAEESGTTFRIFSGVLCGQRVPAFFDASPALRKRPMVRITTPLRSMGAKIKSRKLRDEEYPPFLIEPVKSLHNINYSLQIASAQVKSAILLASLYAKGITTIKEPYLSRDHTERILSIFGVDVKRKANLLSLKSPRKLVSPGQIFIPSDFSSAAFFIILGLVIKDSEILIKDVNLNPTRCGLLKILNRMGAKIKIHGQKNYFEPYGDLLIKSSDLRATEIKPYEIPTMVDEVQVLCVAASFAKGETIIRGVKELKIKETDRLKSIVYNLTKAGVKISTSEYILNGKRDWLIKIKGGTKFKKTSFKSFGDHRTAMSAVVLATASGQNSSLDGTKCIDKSFPQFISLFESL